MNPGESGARQLLEDYRAASERLARTYRAHPNSPDYRREAKRLLDRYEALLQQELMDLMNASKTQGGSHDRR